MAGPALLQKADPHLDVRCLGQFYVEHGGMQITPHMVQRRGALSLLKLLLRRPGHVLSRDALAEAMWPELDPRLGAQRLYVLVHALRQTIEPPGQGRQWLFVRNEGDSYYFNTDAPYALDVQEFQAHVRQGEKEEAAGRAAEAIASYEKAVDLYRGDYLEDEPYADWASEERERLREMYLVVLDRLAERYRKAGAVERSIACYQRSLRADALREKTCRDLMLALWQAGRRVEALRTYEAFSCALEKELGIRPMRDTQDLYACIRVDSSS
jgi:DNA-binding SARP family transcriptional activator